MPKPKRAALDTHQFHIELPPQARDPLESVIPTTPQPLQVYPPTTPAASSPQERDHAREPRQTPLPSIDNGKPSTSELPKSVSSGVRKLRSYELRKFDELRRLDIRITGEQKRFLDDLEEDIRQAMPEGDKSNPESQRITKNSIIRAMLEIARQLKLKVDGKAFHNENDLLHALFEELARQLPNSRSSEVRK